MKKLLYCVRDDIAEVFMPPFASINDNTAMRDFINGVHDKQEKNDLTLYQIGQFNDASGIVVPLTSPKRLLSGLEVTANEQETIDENEVVSS